MQHNFLEINACIIQVCYNHLKRFTINMPDELHRQLKIASVDQDESMNILVMRALREWLKRTMVEEPPISKSV